MKRLIVADDDPGLQEALSLVFRRAGYEVTVFSSGVPLLENQFDPPDGFMLDRQLSGVDGLDVCRFLKSQSNTSHIPVIMLSASPNIAAQAREAGANDFIEKPFRIKDLLTKVREFVGG